MENNRFKVVSAAAFFCCIICYLPLGSNRVVVGRSLFDRGLLTLHCTVLEPMTADIIGSIAVSLSRDQKIVATAGFTRAGLGWLEVAEDRINLAKSWPACSKTCFRAMWSTAERLRFEVKAEHVMAAGHLNIRVRFTVGFVPFREMLLGLKKAMDAGAAMLLGRGVSEKAATCVKRGPITEQFPFRWQGRSYLTRVLFAFTVVFPKREHDVTVSLPVLFLSHGATRVTLAFNIIQRCDVDGSRGEGAVHCWVVKASAKDLETLPKHIGRSRYGPVLRQLTSNAVIFNGTRLRMTLQIPRDAAPESAVLLPEPPFYRAIAA